MEQQDSSPPNASKHSAPNSRPFLDGFEFQLDLGLVREIQVNLPTHWSLFRMVFGRCSCHQHAEAALQSLINIEQRRLEQIEQIEQKQEDRRVILSVLTCQLKEYGGGLKRVDLKSPLKLILLLFGAQISPLPISPHPEYYQKFLSNLDQLASGEYTKILKMRGKDVGKQALHSELSSRLTHLLCEAAMVYFAARRQMVVHLHAWPLPPMLKETVCNPLAGVQDSNASSLAVDFTLEDSSSSRFSFSFPVKLKLGERNIRFEMLFAPSGSVKELSILKDGVLIAQRSLYQTKRATTEAIRLSNNMLRQKAQGLFEEYCETCPAKMSKPLVLDWFRPLLFCKDGRYQKADIEISPEGMQECIRIMFAIFCDKDADWTIFQASGDEETQLENEFANITSIHCLPLDSFFAQVLKSFLLLKGSQGQDVRHVNMKLRRLLRVTRSQRCVLPPLWMFQNQNSHMDVHSYKDALIGYMSSISAAKASSQAITLRDVCSMLIEHISDSPYEEVDVSVFARMRPQEVNSLRKAGLLPPGISLIQVFGAVFGAAAKLNISKLFVDTHVGSSNTVRLLGSGGGLVPQLIFLMRNDHLGYGNQVSGVSEVLRNLSVARCNPYFALSPSVSGRMFAASGGRAIPDWEARGIFHRPEGSVSAPTLSSLPPGSSTLSSLPPGSSTLSSRGSPTLSSRASPPLSSRGSPTLSSRGSPTLSSRGSPTLSSRGSPPLSLRGSPPLSSRGSPPLSLRGSPPTVSSQPLDSSPAPNSSPVMVMRQAARLAASQSPQIKNPTPRGTAPSFRQRSANRQLPPSRPFSPRSFSPRPGGF